MKTVFRIARKEFGAFFSSPIAFIFFGTFLAVTLIVFFWVETFFARNIAEMRALFQWLPLLLIFLTAALTMRSWAEERRAGTLEFLLTSSANPIQLVLGKFLACLGLVAVGLLLTLPLTISVSFMGNLDWGPVAAGYLAALCLAGAYIAIGLCVSARSDNQIISLITTVLVCGFFFLLGSDTLTAFFGNRASEILKLLGAGSRFDSITRGVIDLRDLYYYLGLIGVFLSFNVYGLERIRWDNNRNTSHHLRWQVVTVLCIANFLAANFWLAPIDGLRIDTTQGKIYSISDTTRSYLAQLKEPLLIRGYFSAKTHPLLAPLVPRLRDLMREYGIAGHGKVRVEFVDPQENPTLEREAGEKYNIKPVPFQTRNKYQASVTNSYFDILVKYGDQFETLSFQDLIEVKDGGDGKLDVDLRNPEYDLTRAIKKTLYSYQGSGNLFTGLSRPIKLTAYLSPDSVLPEELVNLKKDLTAKLEELTTESNGKFTSQIIDPDAGDGSIAKKIGDEYGFRPMVASLFDTRSFWFYLVADDSEQTVRIPLPEDLSKEGLKRTLDAGLKRFSRGYTKTVALYTPPTTQAMPQYGIPSRGKHFQWLKDKLGEENSVKPVTLKNGQVPEDADILIVAAPDNLDEKQLFAIDQYLMRGGTVILATSTFDVKLSKSIDATPNNSGLTDWLAWNGLSLAKEMVLDPQSSSLPVPVERQIAGFTVRETRLVGYPYLVDIRQDGMNRTNGITAGLNQLTMGWATPITVDKDKNKTRQVTTLLESSANSWSSESTNVMPDFERYGKFGFAEGDVSEKGKKLLAVAVEGGFTSYFSDRPSPLLPDEKSDNNTPDKKTQEKKDKEKKDVITRLITRSPESARIILLSSDSFFSDTSLRLASAVDRTSYDAPVQLVSNAIDWSLEDRGLLSIRGRGHFARPLIPMSNNERIFWEYLNYALGLAGLIVVWGLTIIFRKRARMRNAQFLPNNMGRN